MDRKRLGRPSIDEETVGAVHMAFHCSPRKSIYVASNEVAEEIFQCIDDDNDYLKCVVFSEEASFHVSRKVNKYNVQIWGS